MAFDNRTEAGARLAARLATTRLDDAIVLALPRGGVPVGAEIAKRLGLPLDVLLVRKIGAPGQPELAVGAVSKRNRVRITVNRDIACQLGLSDEDVSRMGEEQAAVIERRRKALLGDRSPLLLDGKTVIVVDDGVATGATARAALQIVRQERPARLILALPVAPADGLEALSKLADEVVCISTPAPFFSVGTHYRDFSQVSDAEVIELLRRLGRPGLQDVNGSDDRPGQQT
ncbi:phosphoribosyltransferase [Oricola sp.]|uniref:phosphoribosyltransferase n=1 Tax=Oricola sp. TaxID=1979950 RepID=UPI003BAC4909